MPVMSRSRPRGAAATGTTPGDAFADPSASILGSMTLDKLWDWTGGSPLADWYLHDAAAGNDPSNGERSGPKPANVSVIDDTSCMGNKCLDLLLRRETYDGYPLSGVQMEAAGFVWGVGSPFYAEVRIKWPSYLGAWVGPWFLQFPTSPNREMDIMETINFRGPKTTCHSPSIATQDYGPSTNDEDWHRYGMKVTSTDIKWYYEETARSGVMTHVLTHSNATNANLFEDASMFAKIQHFAGGSFPEFDNGGPIADGDLPTSDKHFYCDYIRVYN